jgi:hypothetical protein
VPVTPRITYKDDRGLDRRREKLARVLRRPAREDPILAEARREAEVARREADAARVKLDRAEK